MSNVLVFDLETIPDRTVWNPEPPPTPAPPPAQGTHPPIAVGPGTIQTHAMRPLFPPPPGGIVVPPPVPEKRGRGRRPLSPEEKAARKAERDAAKNGGKPKLPFPPRYAHQVVCIGYVTLTDGVPNSLGSLFAGSQEEEKAMLTMFNDFVTSSEAAVVTWNGRAFDIPVLELRSLRHAVSQSWFGSAARRRYDEGAHIDLFEVCTDYGAIGRDGYSLDTLAKLIGLPGKNGTDGTMVQSMFESGAHEDIKAYCRRDVVQTAYLYLRYRLLRGQIDLEGYRTAAQALRRQWQGDEAFSDFVVDAAILEP